MKTYIFISMCNVVIIDEDGVQLLKFLTLFYAWSSNPCLLSVPPSIILFTRFRSAIFSIYVTFFLTIIWIISYSKPVTKSFSLSINWLFLRYELFINLSFLLWNKVMVYVFVCVSVCVCSSFCFMWIFF